MQHTRVVSREREAGKSLSVGLKDKFVEQQTNRTPTIDVLYRN